MKSRSIRNRFIDWLIRNYRLKTGMTLIEVIIYSALLAILLAGFIQYAWTIHFNDIKLSHDIEDAYEK
jgi:type II secretory pathway pseudopilin PulG